MDEIGHAVRGQPQFTGRDHMALPAQVLAAHHVPQAHAHIKAAIGQGGDAADSHRIGAALTPQAGVQPGVFIGRHTRCVHRAKHAAALQVGADDGADFLGRLRFTGKQRQADGQLGQAHTRDLDTKLRQCRQGSGCQQAG